MNDRDVAEQVVNAPTGATRRLALREDVLCVDDEELGQLLEALRRLDLGDAEAVADQIAALRLAGGVIHLMPTEAEIGALELALAVLAAEARPLGPGLSRLASICAGEDPSGEGRAA